jgi:hypothetical protein
MFIQAHQEIVKKLVELIGITSIMEVCFRQHLFFVLLYIIFLLVFIVKLKMSKCWREELFIDPTNQTY